MRVHVFYFVQEYKSLQFLTACINPLFVPQKGPPASEKLVFSEWSLSMFTEKQTVWHGYLL
jgi:hypothetical protein